METTLFLAAALFIVAGAAFLYLTLRGNERFMPEGGLQWATSVFSVLLLGVGGVFLFMLINPPEAPLSPSQSEQAHVGEAAEDFSFRLVESDDPGKLSDFAGQPVLLNFWATWCAPCLEEMPDLNRLQQTYGDDGLVVLLISDEHPDTLLDFEREMALDPVTGYIDSPRDLPEPFDSVARGRPISFLIDGEGVIRYFQRGLLDIAEFERIVQPYLQSAVATR